MFNICLLAGGFKIAADAFGGKSGFALPATSTSTSKTSNSGFTFGGNSTTGSGFKFGGDSGSTSSGGGFKFGDSAIGTSDKNKSLVKEDHKEEPKTSLIDKSGQLGSGVSFGGSKSGDGTSKSKSDSLSDSKDKPVGGFVFGKSSSDSSASTDNVTKLSSDKTVILDNTKLSVTTSTVATTGITFTSKSDCETKTTVSTTPGGFSFGQSISSSVQKPTTNGGFVFGQPSSVNTDSGIDLKTSSVNSVFGNSIVNKTDSGNNIPVFGTDSKTSVNSFSGTNNSGMLLIFCVI